ncbi:HNH endonuclease [Terrihalobacillus insolitus]|uniref:HNH endonuclease n=1 Tax=Terrihalobacillus insolitus TaxID=2950438 RepID=UPI002340B633|nr:HNH endonuclease [Terrihalobacillus insolitus]MDC3414281.1 HNH endonuclease [Terrihalobacillus insolitus]
MPLKPKKPCNKQGCTNLTRERYCDDHKQEAYAYDKYRESASKRGYNHKWRKARNTFLVNNPICVKCGRVADVVDHIKPHKGDKRLFWSQSNWQSMCSPCHNAKTAKEDMGSW